MKVAIELRKYLVLVLGVLFCQPLLAAGDKLPVWTVSAGAAQVVLLGSVHLAFEDVYPLRREIEEAFANADKLVVEVDIGGPGAQDMQVMMLQKGLLPAGETLREHLSEPVWQSLEKYLRSRGLPLAGFLPLRPGLVVITLSTMRLMEMGMRPELGIDQHFLDAARGEKPILELESAEQQIDLLLAFDDADLLVEQTLAQLDEIDLYMRRIYDAWKAGDSAALSLLLFEDGLQHEPRFREIYELMFDRRNAAMTEQIVQYLSGQGRYFVVVGAGHLVGHKGIIPALEQRGYDVAPL